jgi:lysine-N-methylase
MRYHIPYYYKEFGCIGGDCADTCCSGWKIAIDDDSMHTYLHTPGAFGRRLRMGIDRSAQCFHMKGRNCSFLAKDGLCDIYRELGREKLCETCRRYPRHMEDYGTLREITLSLSCPEAARIILEDAHLGEFKCRVKRADELVGEVTGDDAVLLTSQPVEWKDDPKYEKAPWTDLKWLEQARGTLITMMRDRSMPLKQRMAMAVAYAHDLQNHWDRVRIEEEDDDRQTARMEAEEEMLTARYLRSDAPARFAEKMKKYENRGFERMIRMAAWMREAGELEPVLDHWKAKLARISTKLYHELRWEEYCEAEKHFSGEAAGLALEWENLAIYFIEVYVLGSLYDGNFYDKMKFVAFSCMMIREWCLYRYVCTGRIQRETLAGAAYRYAREVENSDENLDQLETWFLENPLFELDSMLTVICGNAC